MWARGRLPAFPFAARLCSPGPVLPSLDRRRPPGAGCQEQTPPDARNEAEALLVKPDFIGGRPGRASIYPRVARRQGRRVRLGRPCPAGPLPRGAGGAARTAHRLPRRRRRRAAASTPRSRGRPGAPGAPRGGELRCRCTAEGGSRTTSGEGGGGGALTSRAAATSARARARGEGRGEAVPAAPNPGGTRAGWAGPLRRTGRSIGPGGGASRRAGE